jgi:AraC-like DNA-binding protein
VILNHYTINDSGKRSERPLIRYTEGDMESIRIIPRSEMLWIGAAIPKGMASFYFSGKQGARFSFRGGAYEHTLPGESTLLLFYPNRDASFEIIIPPKEELFAVHIALTAMHRLFTQNDHELHFLKPENVEKEFFEERSQVAGVTSALHQIHSQTKRGELENVFVISKTYEILYHHFKSHSGDQADRCPFLADQNNVDRIRRAKNILHEELRDTPSIKELARRVGMNETHLKSGFKEIYGCPIYTWVVEQRLSQAHDMFVEGTHNVNEVADQIGYSNVSQFISAFKKRYGLTPGKFLRKIKQSVTSDLS